jgi:hypothetical protein
MFTAKQERQTAAGLPPAINYPREAHETILSNAMNLNSMLCMLSAACG